MIFKLRKGDDVRMDNDNDGSPDDMVRCPLPLCNVFMSTHNVWQAGDERWSHTAPSAGEPWDDGTEWRPGGVDQDSTLVFCESTSLTLVVTSVLTPLSYTGLSKADSSVMLSYGGEDVGILIVFPCSLQWGNRGKQDHEGTNVWMYTAISQGF